MKILIITFFLIFFAVSVFALQGDWTNYSWDDLPGNFNTDLYITPTGIVWATFRNGTFAKFQDEHWIAYDTSDGIEYDSWFWVVSGDEQGHIWVSRFNRGVYEIDDKNTPEKDDDIITLYNTENTQNGISDNWIEGIVSDDDNYIYLAIEKGAIDVLTPDSLWFNITPDNSPLPIFDISTLFIDNNDIIWIGFENNGIECWDNNSTPTDTTDDTWQYFNSADGLVNDYITGFAEDKQGQLWITTKGGVSKFVNNTWTNFTINDGLIDINVSSVDIDAEGNKWFGTEGGVSCLSRDERSWYSYTTTNGLIDNRVENIIIEKERGYIWIGTQEGISLYESGIMPPSNFEESIVYPNPYVSSQNDTKITFDKLPKQAELYIYTLSGDIIKHFQFADTIEGQLTWDIHNENGELVASGIYYYIASDNRGNKWQGKIAIIR